MGLNATLMTSQGTRPVRRISYPDQFFSLSDYIFPAEVKSLFKWCKYFFYKDPVIGPVVKKLASYPITEIVYSTEDDNDNIKKVYRHIMEKVLDARTVMTNAGIAYFTYGNAILSIYYPFSRNLICPKCFHRLDITNNKFAYNNWTYSVHSSKPVFELKECASCGYTGPAIIDDVPMQNIKAMNVIHWDVNDIDLLYYDVTGKTRYFYKPDKVARQRIIRDRYVFETYPLEFLESVASGKPLELDPTNLIHFKNNTLPDNDQGWGKPLIIHVLQRLFYAYTLRRANEAIAIERIIPLDIFSPPAGSNNEFYAKVGYSQWSEHVLSQLELAKKDPNHKALMPLPLQIQRIGGDGKTLLLHQEIIETNKEIIAGMGVPLEFHFGGLSWTGSSITLRMLENFFQGYRMDLQKLLDFLRDATRQVINIPLCTVTMTELLMADDIQRMQLAMQLNTSNLLSSQDLLKEFGWDLQEQWDKIQKEQINRAQLMARQMKDEADAQGEANVISSQLGARAQVEGQKIMNSAQQDIDESLPIVQRKAKQFSDLGQLMQYFMMFMQMMQEIQAVQNPQPQQQLPPGSEGGGPPPEGDGQAGGAPPPEGGGQGGGPPQPSPHDQAMQQANQQATMGPMPASEPPMVNRAQYGNPFYGAQGGTPTPDLQANFKRKATALNAMPMQQRMAELAAIQRVAPKVYQAIVGYMRNTPPGGTASDAR